MEKASLFSSSMKISQQDIEITKENLEILQYTYSLEDSLYDSFLYYAGTPQQRANEINSCFRDKSSNILFGIMGGMGAVHTLEFLDKKVVKSSKKILVGYSDVTILLLTIHKISKKVRCIHGPNLAQNVLTETKNKKITLRYLKKVLNKQNYKIKVNKKHILIEQEEVKAPIYGGNLSLMVRTLGTPYEINTKGKILFFEQNIYTAQMIFDQFWQLKLAGKLDNIKGVILGNFKRAGKEIDEYLIEFFKEFNIPVIFNQRIGHIHPNISIPLGEMCVLNTQRRFWEIRFDEVEK